MPFNIRSLAWGNIWREQLKLNHEKTVEDVRGKSIFYSLGNNFLGIVETKKGYARGGHYRKIPQILFILEGKIKYIEKDLSTNLEKTREISSTHIIEVPPNTANLLIAIEDTLFIEILREKETGINYPEYRQIVEEKMKSLS